MPILNLLNLKNDNWRFFRSLNLLTGILVLYFYTFRQPVTYMFLNNLHELWPYFMGLYARQYRYSCFIDLSYCIVWIYFTNEQIHNMNENFIFVL